MTIAAPWRSPSSGSWVAEGRLLEALRWPSLGSVCSWAGASSPPGRARADPPRSAGSGPLGAGPAPPGVLRAAATPPLEWRLARIRRKGRPSVARRGGPGSSVGWRHDEALVVGATGRTGRLVVEEALGAGHAVRALSRSVRSGALPDGVEAFPATSARPGWPRRPWRAWTPSSSPCPWCARATAPATITTPLDLYLQTAQALLPACEAAGVARYVTVSAHGVGDSRPRAGWAFLALVHGSNIGVAYDNLAEAEERVRASALDWTVVRPPGSPRPWTAPGRRTRRCPPARRAHPAVGPRALPGGVPLGPRLVPLRGVGDPGLRRGPVGRVPVPRASCARGPTRRTARAEGAAAQQGIGQK